MALVRRCVVTAGALGFLAALPAVANASVTVERHPVYAGANAYFGTCPFEPGPPGTSCTETYLIVWRGYDSVGGGSQSRGRAPWNAEAINYRFDFDGTDDPPLTILRTGDAVLAEGAAAADPVQLQQASATFTMTMSDGTPFNFSGVWNADGASQHYGHDGPLGGFQHFADRCQVFVSQAHQNFASAEMIGTLNGQAVESYPWEFAAAILHNNFTYVYGTHPDCA